MLLEGWHKVSQTMICISVHIRDSQFWGLLDSAGSPISLDVPRENSIKCVSYHKIKMFVYRGSLLPGPN